MQAEPFRIEVPQSVLDDLRDRISRTRWPDEIAGSGWEQGTNLAALRDLLEHWARFDWRARERELNPFAHFRARIRGLCGPFIPPARRRPPPLPLAPPYDPPGRLVDVTMVIPRLPAPAPPGPHPPAASCPVD